MARQARKTIPGTLDRKAAMEPECELRRETDRGCALVAAAWIDERLASLLHTVFEAMSGSHEKIFDDLLWGGATAPLSGTAQKSRLCCALGILDCDTHDAIVVVNRIRSHHFAHFAHEISFQQKEVLEAVAFLRNFGAASDDEFASLSDEGISEARQLFTNAVMKIIRTIRHVERVIADTPNLDMRCRLPLPLQRFLPERQAKALPKQEEAEGARE